MIGNVVKSSPAQLAKIIEETVKDLPPLKPYPEILYLPFQNAYQVCYEDRIVTYTETYVMRNPEKFALITNLI